MSFSSTIVVKIMVGEIIFSFVSTKRFSSEKIELAILRRFVYCVLLEMLCIINLFSLLVFMLILIQVNGRLMFYYLHRFPNHRFESRISPKLSLKRYTYEFDLHSKRFVFVTGNLVHVYCQVVFALLSSDRLNTTAA